MYVLMWATRWWRWRRRQRRRGQRQQYKHVVCTPHSTPFGGGSGRGDDDDGNNDVDGTEGKRKIRIEYEFTFRSVFLFFVLFSAKMMIFRVRFDGWERVCVQVVCLCVRFRDTIIGLAFFTFDVRLLLCYSSEYIYVCVWLVSLMPSYSYPRSETKKYKNVSQKYRIMSGEFSTCVCECVSNSQCNSNSNWFLSFLIPNDIRCASTKNTRLFPYVSPFFTSLHFTSLSHIFVLLFW